MVDIISSDDLSAYLSVAATPALDLIVQKTNALITEHWDTPIDPVPTRVWALAVNIATRALSNPRGLSSWTRSWDDISRTERMEGDALGRLGLYITDEEIAELNGAVEDPPAGIGTIRVRTRDQVCPPPWSSQC